MKMIVLPLFVMVAIALTSAVAAFSDKCTADSQCFRDSCCMATGCTTSPPYCPAGLACAMPCVGPVPGCFNYTCGCDMSSNRCVVKDGNGQPVSPPATTTPAASSNAPAYVPTTTPAYAPPTPTATSDTCSADSECYPDSCCVSTGCTTTPPFCPAGLACAAPCVGPVPGCFNYTCGCDRSSKRCVVKNNGQPIPQPPTTTPSTSSDAPSYVPLPGSVTFTFPKWAAIALAFLGGCVVAGAISVCVCRIRERRDAAAAAAAKPHLVEKLQV